MSSRRTSKVPARLEGTRRRFERWRSRRLLGSRIPDALWAAAAKMAGIYGMGRTASVLGVDYQCLKRRAEKRAGSVRSVPRDKRMAAFIELAPTPISAGECTVEFEQAGRARMRLHLKGVPAPDLIALSRSFWGVEP